MKKNILVIGVFATLAVTLSGFATNGTQPTPAQLVAQICPVTQTVGTLAETAALTDPKLALDLAVAKPIVDALCANGAAVSTANLQAFSTSVVPVLLKVVDASPLDPAKAADVKLGIAAAQLLATQAIALQGAAAVSNPALVAAPQK